MHVMPLPILSISLNSLTVCSSCHLGAFKKKTLNRKHFYSDIVIYYVYFYSQVV